MSTDGLLKALNDSQRYLDIVQKQTLGKSEAEWLIETTVTNFAKILGGNNLKSVFERSTVAALGPITAGTIESLGKRVAILPKENTTASLLQALASHYRGE